LPALRLRSSGWVGSFGLLRCLLLARIAMHPHSDFRRIFSSPIHWIDRKFTPAVWHCFAYWLRVLCWAQIPDLNDRIPSASWSLSVPMEFPLSDTPPSFSGSPSTQPAAEIGLLEIVFVCVWECVSMREGMGFIPCSSWAKFSSDSCLPAISSPRC